MLSSSVANSNIKKPLPRGMVCNAPFKCHVLTNSATLSRLSFLKSKRLTREILQCSTPFSISTLGSLILWEVSYPIPHRKLIDVHLSTHLQLSSCCIRHCLTRLDTFLWLSRKPQGHISAYYPYLVKDLLNILPYSRHRVLRNQI